MHKILLVEDDDSLAFVIQDNLEQAEYNVTRAANGRQAVNLFEKNIYDLAILDVMLPELDGFAVAAHIKEQQTQELPLLFLTAKSLNEDRLQGLRLGADDYLTKPFNMEELLLRIKAILKRSGRGPQNNIIRLGDYTFEKQNLKLSHPEQEKTLTHREAELLNMLILHKNQTIARDQLLLKIWGGDDYFKGRSMDVFITKLRKYLGKDPNIRLNNVHGVGFRLEAP
jgi:DNA-binding response OmpR family regulator